MRKLLERKFCSRRWHNWKLPIARTSDRANDNWWVSVDLISMTILPLFLTWASLQSEARKWEKLNNRSPINYGKELCSTTFYSPFAFAREQETGRRESSARINERDKMRRATRRVSSPSGVNRLLVICMESSGKGRREKRRTTEQILLLDRVYSWGESEMRGRLERNLLGARNKI